MREDALEACLQHTGTDWREVASERPGEKGWGSALGIKASVWNPKKQGCRGRRAERSLVAGGTG